MMKEQKMKVPPINKFIPLRMRMAAIASLTVGGSFLVYVIMVAIKPEYHMGGVWLLASALGVSGLLIMLSLVLTGLGYALGNKRFLQHLCDNYTIDDLVIFQDSPEFTKTERWIITAYLNGQYPG